MSVLDRLASALGRRDDAPNQALARELAQTHDAVGIQEIAAGLWSGKAQVQSDCIKVLYETGYLEPLLVAPYAADYVRLLKSKNNRLVWGGMIALSTVAGLRPEVVDQHLEEIQTAMEKGSVITVDGGVVALARAAATSPERRARILPYLLRHLETCHAKEIPQHAEKTLIAIDAGNKERFIAILTSRMAEMTGSQQARVRRVLRVAEKQ